MLSNFRTKKKQCLSELLNGFEHKASCFRKKSKTDLLAVTLSSDARHDIETRRQLAAEFRLYVAQLNKKHGGIFGGVVMSQSDVRNTLTR